MISMKKFKRNRSVDNNNARVILLKKTPTFVRIMKKSKGIVFIIHVTTCDTTYIIVVNMNPKQKSGALIDGRRCANNVNIFKRLLKTHLFRDAFSCYDKQ